MPQFDRTSAAALEQPDDSNNKTNDDVSTKLSAEAQLLGSLPKSAIAAAAEHLKEHPKEIATETAVAVGVGLGLAALSKNPELLGARCAPFIKSGLPWVGRIAVAAGVADWSLRLGVPMYQTWQNPDEVDAAKKLLGKNVGEGVVDYAAMGIGGYAGAKTAFRFVPEYPNRAPKFDLHPSDTIGEKPRPIENPERFTTKAETTLEPDVVKLYERSFPIDERQPTDEVRQLIESGKILVHTTRTADGELQAFSFLSRHDETPVKFANLDFIATQESGRSQGLGSLHLQRLVPEIRNQFPQYKAMTIEMEDPRVPGLDPETLALRLRRARFYDRLDAPDTGINYNILDFNEPDARIPARFRAFVFDQEKFNPVETARTFYLDEAGYGRSPRDPAVRQLESENGYFTPPIGPLGSALSTDALTNWPRPRDTDATYRRDGAPAPSAQ